MKKQILIIGVSLILLLLWWTRYQYLGTVNQGAPFLLDRLTGRVYLVLPDGWEEWGIKPVPKGKNARAANSAERYVFEDK